MKSRFLLLAAFTVLASGCYHATIDTGRAPSTTTIEKRWANGWIYGLVPPSTVETAQKCTNGIAKVSTQLSFANQLVSFLTMGIYTPMEIIVTCADSRSASLPTLKAGSDAKAAIAQAAELSNERKGTAVIVQF